MAKYTTLVTFKASDEEIAELDRLRDYVRAETGKELSRGACIRMAINGNRPDLLAQAR